MEAARHKTYDNAMRYASACRALHNLHKKQPIGSSSENEVGLWKSPFIGKDSVLAQVVNRNSQGFSDSLPNLAKRFVLEHLGLNEKDPKLRDIPTLFRKAEAYRRPESPVEKLMEWQKKHAVNDEDAQQAHKLFHHAVQQRAREMVARQQNQVSQFSIAPANAPNAPWPQLPATPPSVYRRSQENSKRVRKEGDTPICQEDRDSYTKKRRTGEKLVAGKSLLDKYPESDDCKLDKKSRTFMARLRKPVKCFHNHCNQDVLVFESRFGKIDWSAFPCGGVGDLRCYGADDDE
jgi:hypothetical protein